MFLKLPLLLAIILICRIVTCESALNSHQNSTTENTANITEACTDFYTHVCRTERWRSFSANTGQPYSTIEEDVDSFTDSLFADAFDSENRLNSPNSSRSQAVQFFLDLYAECRKQQQKNRTLFTTFLDMLPTDLEQLMGRRVGEGIFTGPETGSSKTENTTTSRQRWLELFVQYYLMTGEGLIVDINPVQETKDTSRVRLGFSRNDNSILESFFLAQLTETRLTGAFSSLQAIAELQTFISKIPESDELLELVDLLQRQESLTLSDLVRQTGVNWTEAVNSILRQTGSQALLNGTERIYADLEFISKATKLIEETPVRIFENYVMLQYSIFVFTAYGKDCRIHEALNAVRLFTYINSRVYVDAFMRRTSRSHVEAIRSNVTQMVDAVRRQFRPILQSNAASSAEAFARLRTLNASIGYSDWFMDDGLLDAWYGLVDEKGNRIEVRPQIVPGNYMASLRAWIRHWIPVNWLKRSGFTADKVWALPVSTSNAWHHTTFNHIYIPLGNLVPATFNLTASPATHYAVIGFTIGHEIAHAFTGNSATFSIFNALGSCIHAQYHPQNSSTLPATPSDDDLYRMTYENFADHVGLKAAYATYQRMTAATPHPKAPQTVFPLGGHHHLPKKVHQAAAGKENDRQFFYSFARRFCSSYDEIFEKLWNGTSQPATHAAHKLRVNLPLANFEPFAKAYGCQLGSPMNRVKKCTIR